MKFIYLGPYLSRVGGTFGTPSDDCYYLLLADANRTKVMIDQTVDILQQRVRTNPIPVVTELDQVNLLSLHSSADSQN